MTGPEVGDHPRIPSPVSDASLPEFEYGNLTRGDRVGTGGDADVYRATIKHVDETRTVALKEPRFEGTIQQRVLSRFQSEAETWAKIDDHDNVVTVHAWGTAPLPWMALEFMDGGTLQARLGDYDIDEALWLAGRIAEGIRHGHRRGVAHLDIKPSNVLLRETDAETWDYPKVSDWGLAKLLLEHSQSVTGLSPQYAAPEQFDPDEFGAPDDLTDIYQLGGVVYALVTGEPPFTGSSTEVMQSVLRDDPVPPSEVDSTVPPAVDDTVLKALATEKSDRYESVLLLRRDLDQLFAAHVDTDVRTTTPTNATPDTPSQPAADTHSTTTDDEQEGASAPVSRRALLAALGVGALGVGGVVSGSIDTIDLGDSSPGQTRSTPRPSAAPTRSATEDGTSSSTSPDTSTPSLSMDSLDELWTGTSYIWNLFTGKDLFFALEGAQEGLIITGRQHESGQIQFRSRLLDEGYTVDESGAFALDATTLYMGLGAPDRTDLTNARLYGFDRTDGSVRFRFDTPTDGKHGRIKHVTKVADGPLVFGADGDGVGSEQEPLLFAVDPSTGTERWRVPLSSNGFVNDIAVWDGTVYAAASGVRLYDPATGNQRRALDLSAFYGFTISDGLLVTSGETITAYDLRKGATAWKATPAAGTVKQRVTATDSRLYAATDTGYVLALEKSSGDTIWSTRVRGGVSHESPSIAGGAVWISTDNGSVSVLVADSGREAFNIAPSPNNEDDARPVATIDDVLYLGGVNPVAYRL